METPTDNLQIPINMCLERHPYQERLIVVFRLSLKNSQLKKRPEQDQRNRRATAQRGAFSIFRSDVVLTEEKNSSMTAASGWLDKRLRELSLQPTVSRQEWPCPNYLDHRLSTSLKRSQPFHPPFFVSQSARKNAAYSALPVPL
jgi:hypothetical protein